MADSMGQRYSSITRKSRSYSGRGIRVAGLTAVNEHCRRFRTTSLWPQPAPGFPQVRRARKADRRNSMATYQINVNGQHKQVKVDPSTPLLWVLREELKLTGTKYGCGISACGASTV